MDQGPHRFKSFDGIEISYHLRGPAAGRPTLVLHGFLADAQRNWIDQGTADAMAALGRWVILPDIRAHGASQASHDPAAYPKDVIPADQEALLAHLGVGTYDVVGYSLGARAAVRLAVRGVHPPARMILGGMGASGICDVAARQAQFEDGIRNGAKARDPEQGARIQVFLQAQGTDRDAALAILATQVSSPQEALAQLTQDTLVVCGARDRDNGDPDELTALLPHARCETVPGNHLSAVEKPEFQAAILAFLGSG